MLVFQKDASHAIFNFALLYSELLNVAASQNFDRAEDRGAECRCTDPSDPCWPSNAEWQQLNLTVGGRLIVPMSPLASCNNDADVACRRQLNQSMTTPFWDQHFAGGSFYTGWYGAWKPALSIYAVAAQSIADIQAAVSFAARRNLRLVVKGTGSDYLGRSTAPGSLLLWTHHMQQIIWAEDNASVTVEAGVRWGDVYDQAQARGRFVAGGQCPNVGAGGGYSLGGGWSPFARLYGTISHNMIEATIVKANAEIVVANKDLNTDMFWASRGGGGGTFGVAARLTFRAWPAPSQVSFLAGSLSCPDEKSLYNVTESFLSLYPSLSPDQWSDKVFWSRYSLGFRLFFPGLQATVVRKLFAPFLERVNTSACSVTHSLIFDDLPVDHVSNGTRVARLYPYPWTNTAKHGAPGLDDHWYDRGDTHQYFAYYVTRYIPVAEFSRPATLAAKLMSLVQYSGPSNSTANFLLQFNKALGGTTIPKEDIPAPHPSAYDAAAFLDFGWTADNYFPQVSENRDTLTALRNTFQANCADAAGDHGKCLQPVDLEQEEIRACFAAFKGCIANAAVNENPASLVDKLFAGSGTYLNEANFFEKDWQAKFWGSRYARLRAIKNEVDPTGLFVCHHCVGSEDWSADGNCRLPYGTFFT